jgi:serine/threonine-protein kinase
VAPAPPAGTDTTAQALAARADTSETASLSASAPGALAIQVSPWAEVYVNDTALGRTPLDAPVPLPPGTHTVMLRHPQFPDSTTTITLAPGDTTTLTASLWDLVGTVALDVSPWADVYVDGEQRDTTPLERPLIVAPGLHTLTLRNPALGRFDTTITVRRGEEQTLRLNLNRLLAQ